MNTRTKEVSVWTDPAEALELLLEGNRRFCSNHRANRDLMRQVGETSVGQYPAAVILSCMDSRTSAELVFDQGLGDIFSIRVAGNIVSSDVLGSIEYAVSVAGVKLVMVLGHTRCGAVAGACADVRMGHLSGILDKIKPAIDRTHAHGTESGAAYADRVAETNVRMSMDALIEQSPVLRDRVDVGQVGLVGAMYDVASGRVMLVSTCNNVRRPVPKAS